GRVKPNIYATHDDVGRRWQEVVERHVNTVARGPIDTPSFTRKIRAFFDAHLGVATHGAPDPALFAFGCGNNDIKMLLKGFHENLHENASDPIVIGNQGQRHAAT